MLENRIRDSLESIRKGQEFFKEITLKESLPDRETGIKETRAGINLKEHDLIINYNPDFEGLILRGDRECGRYIQKKGIKKGELLKRELEDILRHEIGHRGGKNCAGCPGDFIRNEKIQECLSKESGISSKSKLALFSNYLTDIINETILSRQDNCSGISSMSVSFLFLKEQGKKTELLPECGGKFTKMYEAFVRLRIFLYGGKPEHELLKRYFSYSADVNESIIGFLKESGISDIRSSSVQGGSEILVRDRAGIRQYLMDRGNWDNIAGLFGKHFGRFMNETQKQSLFGSGSSSSESGDSDSNPSDEEEMPKDGFSDEIKDPENQKSLIRKSGGKKPFSISSHDYLKLKYEMLAEDKYVELSSPVQKNSKFPLIGIGKKKFDSESDSPRDIEGIILENGAVELASPEFKYEMDIKVFSGKNRIPDSVIGILDTSGSMLEAMPGSFGLGESISEWRDNSKYHNALIAYFLLVKSFKDSGIYDENVFFASFSDRTLLGRGLEDSKEKALHTQFGGTYLDLNVVSGVMEKKGALSFTISDGEMSNWQDVSKFIIEKIAPVNPYFHIQIGETGMYSRALEHAGVLVKNVQTGRELYSFIINLAGGMFSGK
jgi:hypothetical protein